MGVVFHDTPQFCTPGASVTMTSSFGGKYENESEDAKEGWCHRLIRSGHLNWLNKLKHLFVFE